MTRAYLHIEECWGDPGLPGRLVSFACWGTSGCTQAVLRSRHPSGAEGWRRREGATALERGDWGRGQRPRRGRASMPWYHIASMPGMDRLAEDLLCLYVRLWGGYGDTDQGSWPSPINKN